MKKNNIYILLGRPYHCMDSQVNIFKQRLKKDENLVLIVSGLTDEVNYYKSNLEDLGKGQYFYLNKCWDTYSNFSEDIFPILENITKKNENYELTIQSSPLFAKRIKKVFDLCKKKFKTDNIYININVYKEIPDVKTDYIVQTFYWFGKYGILLSSLIARYRLNKKKASNKFGF